jgi:hypothetical protein
MPDKSALVLSTTGFSMLSSLFDPESDVEFVYGDEHANEHLHTSNIDAEDKVLQSIKQTKQKAMQHLFNMALTRIHGSNGSNGPNAASGQPLNTSTAKRRRTHRHSRNPSEDESWSAGSESDVSEDDTSSNTEDESGEEDDTSSNGEDESEEDNDVIEDESGEDNDVIEDESGEDDDGEEGDGVPASSSSTRSSSARGAASGADACFLCAYCTTDEVRCVTSFICDNIANMEVGFMAQQIREFIFEKRPELQAQSRKYGLEVVAIRKHIRLHMLSPTVRIADMMRHLLSLCDTLKNNLYREDPDTGDVCADRGNIDTYLKIVTQVLNMYKMSEPSKMLFAHADKS